MKSSAFITVWLLCVNTTQSHGFSANDSNFQLPCEVSSETLDSIVLAKEFSDSSGLHLLVLSQEHRTLDDAVTYGGKLKADGNLDDKPKPHLVGLRCAPGRIQGAICASKGAKYPC